MTPCTPLLSIYTVEKDWVPISIDFVYEYKSVCLQFSYSKLCYLWFGKKKACHASLYSNIESEQTGSLIYEINRVVSHPNLSLAITNHKDWHIHFWDSISGCLVQSMVNLVFNPWLFIQDSTFSLAVITVTFTFGNWIASIVLRKSQSTARSLMKVSLMWVSIHQNPILRVLGLFGSLSIDYRATPTTNL